jgi:hypothetical protein
MMSHVELIRYRPAGYARGDCDPRWDLLEACRRMPCQSWRRSQPNGDRHPHQKIDAFLRETHLAAVRSGMLDLSLMLIGGVPAAFAYGYQTAGKVSLLLTGYDRRAAKDDPRQALLAQLAQDGRRRGDTRIDLGAGELANQVDLPICWEKIERYVHVPWTGVRAQAARLDRWVSSRRHGNDLQSPNEQHPRGPCEPDFASESRSAARLRLHVEGDSAPAPASEVAARR